MIKKLIVAWKNSVKRLNLFETYSNDPETIQRELLATRLHILLLPLTVMVLFIYASQKELFYNVQINNPSLADYQQLIEQHPDTLQCPCSQLSVPYSSFLTLTPTFHPICSSVFISDSWMNMLYYENASSFTPNDIRSVGHAQWQLMRNLCQLSRRAIDNAFQATFILTNLIDSRGMLLQSDLVRLQVDASIHDFVTNLNSDHRRQRALFRNFIDRNFLFSGLQTSASAQFNSLKHFTIESRRFPTDFLVHEGMVIIPYCSCEISYDCTSPLAIWRDEYTIETPDGAVLTSEADYPLQKIDGFNSGCFPYNALLESTLRCFYNQQCINNMTVHLGNRPNFSFIALDENVQNESMLNTLLESILDNLMVQSWQSQTNYTRYFNGCRPQSCSYTYTQRFNKIYIIVTLLGLLSGLMKLFRIVSPHLATLIYSMRKPRSVSTSNNNNRTSFRLRINQWFTRLEKRILSLNFFKRRNSSITQVRQQMLTTRLYIGLLFGFTIVLVSITAFEPRVTNISLLTPDLNQFEELYQNGKLPYSCPCSQIAIQRSNFIQLTPRYHQVCSSALISDDWLDRLTYTTDTRSNYYYLDIRSYGLDMFRTIRSFCSLANETIRDAISNFLHAYWIGNRVVPREQFYQHSNTLLIDFQSSLKHHFKRWFDIAREMMRGNQVLSTRISNFFFDGVFNESDHLTHIQTYIGIKLSLSNDTPSTTCSCLLNTCSQPLGFFRWNDASQDFLFLAAVPGMFSACYPMDALRVSTLECWFNDTCIDMVFSHLNPFPVEKHFDPLNVSLLINYSPTTHIGDIIDQLMIEQLLNDTQYENYYNSCMPLVCTYTSIGRFDMLYIFTTFMGVIGGLSVCLRLICPMFIHTYMRYKQRRTVTNIDVPIAAPMNMPLSRISRLKRLLSRLNLFNSQSPYVHIQKREHLSTYLYIMLFTIFMISVSIYLLFVGYTRTITIAWPSSVLVSDLQKKYPTTLSCPCTQTTLPYSLFVSLSVEKYHPICSSSFLEVDYLRMLMGDNLTVIPGSLLFKRQFLGSQLTLLASLCSWTEEALNLSITLFLRQQFVNIQFLTLDQFYEQIDNSINQFYLDLSFSMRYSVDYFQSITHGNAIMSTYMSNWAFYPDSRMNSSKILTKPVWYGNCSCARTTQCIQSIDSGNMTFPGLFIGCLPSSVLLQSTFECFYDQTCVETLHTILLNKSQESLLPARLTLSDRFLKNETIDSLLNELFIERWIRDYDYEAFFQGCAVATCTYIFTRKPDLAYMVTTLVGLIGGLNILLRLICPLITLAYVSLTHRMADPIDEIQIQEPVQSDSRRRRSRCTWHIKWILILTVTTIIIITVVLLRLLSHQKDIVTENFVTTSTLSPSTNNQTETDVLLCSARARWKSEAVTVAGFSNGSSSTSLAGLWYPSDLSVDATGNMYIVDSMNHRIVHWTVNVKSGILALGGNGPGSNPNQLYLPSAVTVGHETVYVSDWVNRRVQSFSSVHTTDLPDVVTIFESSMIESDPQSSIIIVGLAYDKVQATLYLGDYTNQHVIILNRTTNQTAILANIELVLVNTSIGVTPGYILLDEKNDVFYISDPVSNNVFKFPKGTGMGHLVAGKLMSDSITNQLKSPMGLVLDHSGYLYIADMGQNRIVQVLNAQGDLRTIAGTGFLGTSSTRISQPSALGFDSQHNLYVVDSGNNRVQRFDLLDNGC